jgi:hypothetical protein
MRSALVSNAHANDDLRDAPGGRLLSTCDQVEVCCLAPVGSIDQRSNSRRTCTPVPFSSRGRYVSDVSAIVDALLCTSRCPETG